MKSTILLLLLMCNIASAQSKKPIPIKPKAHVKDTVITPKDGEIPLGTIIGIGPFKIGITRIDSLASILNMPFIIDSTYEYLSKGGNKIYEEVETKFDETKGYDQMELYGMSRHLNGYRIVNISDYKYEAIYFLSIDALFKNDTLISFTCKPPAPEIASILEYKYGKPDWYFKSDTIHCIYKISGVIEDKEAFVSRRSWTCGDEEISIYADKKFDEKCIPESFSYFTMEDNSKHDIYYKLQRQKLDSLKNKQLSKY